MNPKKTLLYKERLEALRASLIGDVEKTRQSSQGDEFKELVPDVTDDAARSYTKQLILNLGEQGREQLIQVDEALEKIEKGEYGSCERCEKRIPEARLKLVPFTQYCVTCLNEIEQENAE